MYDMISRCDGTTNRWENIVNHPSLWNWDMRITYHVRCIKPSNVMKSQTFLHVNRARKFYTKLDYGWKLIDFMQFVQNFDCALYSWLSGSRVELYDCTILRSRTWIVVGSCIFQDPM